MRQFTYTRPANVDQAVTSVAQPESKFIGGGTNLIDLMKMGVERPAQLVDITRLPLNTIEEHAGGLRIGALVRNSDLAAHPLIRDRYPVLSQSLLSGATGQLRNLATTGGNLMQRTRCYYFYDPSYRECNKRNPGTGCAAIPGINRIHAILGASPQCIATHPSDMSVALAALEAVIQVQGPKGTRAIPIAEFHRLPGNKPELDTNLQPGELIIAVDLPSMPFARRSTYIKVRDRSSYAFALVSVACALDLDAGKIREARIALGGVAHKPWRVPAAEQTLSGRQPDAAVFRLAADALLKGAQPQTHNTFKIELARRSIIRALTNAAALA